MSNVKLRMVDIGLDKVSSASSIIKPLTPEDFKIIDFNLKSNKVVSKYTKYGYTRAYIEAKALGCYPSLIAEYNDVGLERLIKRWAGLIHATNRPGLRSYNLSKKVNRGGIEVITPVGVGVVCLQTEFSDFCKEMMYGTSRASELYAEFINMQPFPNYNTLIADVLWRLMEAVETEKFHTRPAGYCTNATINFERMD